MATAALSLVLLLQVFGADLTGVAQASVRPRECGSSRPTVWERAREPHLRAYCDALARGFGKLATAPREAKAEAQRATELSPERAAPFVLLGRAELATGAYEAARLAFERARAIDARALDEPNALHAHAIALFRSGREDEALASYRALVPRIDLLTGADRRVRVLVEAAELAMSRGPEHADLALTWLRRARREPLREAQPRVLAMLALVLDRRGDAEQVSVLLEEVRRLGGRKAVEAFASQDVETKEASAVLALVEEGANPRAAAESWERYLAGARAPSAIEHARKRLDRLTPAARAAR